MANNNNFSKEEIVAFDQLMEGFEDQEVLSKVIEKQRVDPTTAARTNDTIWFPFPYIVPSYDGTDATSGFANTYTQLSVPATIGYRKNVPWTMTDQELRDALQANRLGDSAKQKLGSDINVAVLNKLSLQGTIVVTSASAATGFSDIAAVDTVFNNQGIPVNDRNYAFSSQDYNNMAANLAGRQTLSTGKVLTAYEEAKVGRIAGFDGWKLDYSYRLPAAAAGNSITINTTDAGDNIYTPLATTNSNADITNVDNRYQTVTFSSTTSMAAGDAFTIAGVYAVHHIAKISTGALKTFRIISVTDSTHAVISPPIINVIASSPPIAQVQYQNVTIATADKSATAAVTWLNKDAAYVNTFWQGDAIKLIPGVIPYDPRSGAAFISATTESGIMIVMAKQYDINKSVYKYRVDTSFGVTVMNPEKCGIELFSQT